MLWWCCKEEEEGWSTNRPSKIKTKRTTFNVDDWLAKTPRRILARNFGVDESVFANLPATNPNIQNGTVATRNATAAGGDGAAAGRKLQGNASFVYRTLQHKAEAVPGNGGEFRKIDSTNFPVSKTIAATFVTLKPRGLRELHWHPNVCRRAIKRGVVDPTN